MIELWIGLGLLFGCVGVYYWAKQHPRDKTEQAERLYRLDVEADQADDDTRA